MAECKQRKWRESYHPASFEESLDNEFVRCHLSPRHCRIGPGRNGFCGVRGNRDGRLVTMNYGKSVHATEECIETEAIFHFYPGARILSMGNIGCMLNCDYCHNWKTSQARFVDDRDVYRYSPEQVVDIALRHNIDVISWTYNDPVVWHEFVIDTSRLAHSAGIKTLYKSALFISPEAIEDLIPVIDIFSISLKSMDPDYYRKLTKGWIEPVLEGIEQVYLSQRHLEISTLMVTDLSDTAKTAHSVSEFVLDRLDPHIPLHFVRFHPDYKMTDSVRTPISRLLEARRIALDAGVLNVYLGNTTDADVNSTFCENCGELLVRRFGLTASLSGVGQDGNCKKCGTPSGLTLPSTPLKTRQRLEDVEEDNLHRAQFDWHGDIQSLHIHVRNESDRPTHVFFRNISASRTMSWRLLPLEKEESYRFLVSKADDGDRGVELLVPQDVRSSLHEVFDRAHFPTVETSNLVSLNDVTPGNRYPGRKVVWVESETGLRVSRSTAESTGRRNSN